MAGKWIKGFLAISGTWNQFLLISYIVKSTKKQKRTIYSELFALFEKIISYEFFGDKICAIFEDKKSLSL